jgi:Trypsin-co-occurring domain 1
VLVVAGVDPERVFVQVIDVDVVADREITFGRSLAEGLADRQDDIRGAIEAGSQTVAKSIESLPSPQGWRLGEVSASFGITLAAEAGVIVSKASAGATFEVSVKFTRA